MNDISLYDLLKQKAENSCTKNEIMYLESMKDEEYYTYEEVYKLVNKYIDFFSRCNYKNKPLYIIVDNSVKSIAVFIAILKVGIIPILVNINSFYTHSSFIGKDIIYQANNIDFYDATKYSCNNLNEIVYSFEKYINSLNINLDDLSKNKESKFCILTSGSTTGKSKLVTIYEKDLLKKDSSCFNSMKSEYFCTYIPISSISSIVYNLLLPLYKSKKILLTNFFELYEIQDKDISLLIPRDILDILNQENKIYDFSNINKLYLSGEMNNLEFIKEIRKKIPTLKENVFVNLYGSTEALGIISYCNENKLKPIYINQLSLAKNEFIYTYDKINFYKRIFQKNDFHDEKINLKYNDFIYFECLPVSENKVENLKIINNLGEIIYNDKQTGDIGVYVNNQLYIICRVNDVVKIDNKNYFLTAIENLFSKFTGLTSTAINYKNKISVIINLMLDKNTMTNIKNIIPLIKKTYEFANKLSFLPITLPIFVDSNHISKSTAMRKTIKKSLISIIENRNMYEYYIYDYEKNLINKVQSIINNITKNNTNIVEYQKNNLFRIKRTNAFDMDKLLLFLNEIDFKDVSEDKDYFYFKIGDGILINSILKKSWEKVSNPEYVYEMYKENKENFYEYINGMKTKNDKEYIIIIVGKKYFRNDSIIFIPMIIDNIENVNYANFDRNSYDFIYFKIPLRKGILNKEKIKEKIEKLWFFLNHEYSINYNEDFFIDGVKAEKKRHPVYRKLYEILTKRAWNSYIENNEWRKVDALFENLVKQTIVVLNEKYKNKQKWCQLSLDSFDDYQKDKLINYNNSFKAKNDLIKILETLYIDKNNNPILLIGITNDYIIKNNNQNSIFEIVKKYKIERVLNLIELLKKHEPIFIKINHKDILVDFSKLKIIYMIINDELYNEPTISKCIELGYPEEIISQVDRVIPYFEMFKLCKKTKIKRKELE